MVDKVAVFLEDFCAEADGFLAADFIKYSSVYQAFFIFIGDTSLVFDGQIINAELSRHAVVCHIGVNVEVSSFFLCKGVATCIGK